MNTTPTEFGKKLVKVQGTIASIKKNGDNPHFRSNYMTLNDIYAAVKPVLQSEGMFIHHRVESKDNATYVQTIIQDSDGNGIDTKVPVLLGDTNMQKLGAAITYASRYGTVGLLALESEDDDGETAVGRGSNPIKTAIKAKAAPVVVVTSPPSLQELHDSIGTLARIVIAKKLASNDDIKALIAPYGATKREQLNEQQAQTVITYLNKLLEGAK